MAKVIFIRETPLRERDVHRFGFDVLTKFGFTVEVWDLGPWLSPGMLGEKFRRLLPDHYPVDSLRAFRKLAPTIQRQQDFIVYTAGCDIRSWPMLVTLSRTRARLVILSTNLIPANLHSGRTAAVWRRLSSFRPYKLANLIFRNYWPTAWSGIRPASLWVMGGLTAEASYKHNYRHLITAQTERLPAHAMDYDLFLAAPNREECAKPYAVLIDEHLAEHYEYALRGRHSPISQARYDALVTRYLEAFESHTKLPVVIATHPSAKYQAGVFGGRPMVQGRTQELVAHSSAVLAHCSTAVGFAVMYRKPVVLLHCAELVGDPLGLAQSALARALHVVPQPMDCSFQAPPLELDNEAFGRYQQDYLKCPATPEVPLWHVVGNRLLELNQAALP